MLALIGLAQVFTTCGPEGRSLLSSFAHLWPAAGATPIFMMQSMVLDTSSYTEQKRHASHHHYYASKRDFGSLRGIL